MEKIRDKCLVAIQKVLSKYNMGAGKTLNEFKKDRIYQQEILTLNNLLLRQ